MEDGSSPHPPQYCTIPASSPTPSVVLLNLVPLSNNTTFQVGYLGHGPATLEGEIQAKFAGSDDADRPAFSKLELSFRGVERSDAAATAGSPALGEIELTEQHVVLWGEGAQGSSAGPSTTTREHSADDAGADGGRGGGRGGGSGDFPPASSRFKIELTPDLPHCIHLLHSSLDYTLTATLTPSDPTLAPITRSSPVHLVRSSPSSSLLAGLVVPAGTDPLPSITPETLATSDPIELSVRLDRTVFRRSEPIQLRARIEVPSARAVQEDGVRLRTVSAELVRIVTVAGPDSPEGSPTPDAAPPARDLSEDDDERANGPKRPLPPQPPSTSSRETILARSGKSARFSPTRPIVIRLLLHPPASLSCESITQSTILHTISFLVRVTVGITLQPSSTRRDVVLSRAVFIIPDSPSPRSDKQREVERYAEVSPPNWMPADGPVPTYHESANEPSPGEGSGSGSWAIAGGSGFAFGGEDGRVESVEEEEEEYDGYEELSASLSTRVPPPTIDEDVSPPDAEIEDPDPPPGVDDEAFTSVPTSPPPRQPPPYTTLRDHAFVGVTRDGQVVELI
ncbi:hypothetical protein RQP46_001786 [Phenoliferia psychrophenolica]